MKSGVMTELIHKKVTELMDGKINIELTLDHFVSLFAFIYKLKF